MKIEEEIQLAKQMYQKKRYGESAELFKTIALHFEEEGDYPIAAEMQNNASVAFLMSGNAKLAYDMAKDTHKFFQNVGDEKNCGLALGNQAAALEHLGEKGMALELYTMAITHLENAGEEESKAYILKRMSSLQVQQ